MFYFLYFNHNTFFPGLFSDSFTAPQPIAVALSSSLPAKATIISKSQYNVVPDRYVDTHLEGAAIMGACGIMMYFLQGSRRSSAN